MKAFIDEMIGGLIDALVPGCSAKRPEPKTVAGEGVHVRPTGHDIQDRWYLYINADHFPKHGFDKVKKVN